MQDCQLEDEEIDRAQFLAVQALREMRAVSRRVYRSATWRPAVAVCIVFSSYEHNLTCLQRSGLLNILEYISTPGKSVELEYPHADPSVILYKWEDSTAELLDRWSDVDVVKTIMGSLPKEVRGVVRCLI